MNVQTIIADRNLPHQTTKLFLADSGLETVLIFHDGVDLPEFAAFPLMLRADGRKLLARYYQRHAEIALRKHLGFVLETPTWRASADWGAKLGYDAFSLDYVNRRAVSFLNEIREEFEGPFNPMLISGQLGPRGDGYVLSDAMSATEARAYHTPQIKSLAEAGADVITVLTMNYAAEAIGIAYAAEDAGMPSVVSFTVETDGRLPSGQPLGEAIDEVDTLTGNAPAYYMINCAHPSHFQDALEKGEGWLARISGVRANASKMSHAELDEAEELDDGNPSELGEDYRQLLRILPNLKVLGGCCGTDHRHIEALSCACH